MSLVYRKRNENFPRVAFMIKCNNIFYKKIFFKLSIFLPFFLLLLYYYYLFSMNHNNYEVSLFSSYSDNR